MSKEVTKFDAVSYAVGELGEPTRRYAARQSEALRYYQWETPFGLWVTVCNSGDGNQGVSRAEGEVADLVAVRADNDGNLSPGYEAQARGLIDEFARARAEGANE